MIVLAIFLGFQTFTENDTNSDSTDQLISSSAKFPNNIQKDLENQIIVKFSKEIESQVN